MKLVLILVSLAGCSGNESDGDGLVKGLVLSPENPTKLDTLTCAWDSIDGAAIGFVEWKINGVVIDGLDEAELAGDWFERGDRVACVVTPDLPGVAGDSSNTVTIANSAPTVTGGAITPEFPNEDDLLYADVFGTDPDDADEGKLEGHYSWTVNGQPAGVDEWVLGSSYWGEGDVVSASVSLSDGDAISASFELEEVVIQNTSPSAPEIEMYVTETAVHCDVVVESIDPDEGDVVEYHRSWRQFGAWIQGDNASLSLDLVRGGAPVSCAVSGWDEEGPGEVAEASIDIEGDIARYRWSFNSAGGLAGEEIHSLGDIDGDGLNDLMVSTPGSSLGRAEGGGAVLIGSAALGSLIQLEADSVLTTITSPEKQVYMGASIATVPDFDGDGFVEIAMSSADYTNQSVPVGMAVVYSSTSYLNESTISINPFGDPTGTAWTNGDQEGAGMGLAVEGGDINGDGLGDLFVASLGYQGTRTGKIHVYDGVALAAGGPMFNGEMLFEYEGEGEGFGEELSLVGDFDGDGLPDLAVGHPSYDGDTGRVYLFQSSQNTYYSETDFSATRASDVSSVETGADLSNRLGEAISPLEVDGVEYILVGSPGANSGDGSARVFSLSSDGSLDNVAVVYGYTGDSLGDSVGNVGDIDGDGAAEIAIGGTSADGGWAGSGVVYVFDAHDLVQGGSYDAMEDSSHLLYGEQAGESAGASVLGPGDLNGDGRDDLVIGAQHMDAPEGWNEGGITIWVDL
jgi:hypothetical protein